MKKVLGVIMFMSFFGVANLVSGNPNKHVGVVVNVNAGSGVVIVRDNQSGELVSSTNRAHVNVHVGDDVVYIYIRTRGGGIHIVLTDRK